MSLITIPYTFSAGAVIIASQHNSNFTTIASDYNGNIDNTNIVANAGIVYSKLSLTGGIVNADISSSAAIVGSKLDLSSPGAIGATTPNAVTCTVFKTGTTRQGDILYDNGTSIVRLAAGTSGNFLKTLGSGANPLWGAVSLGFSVTAGSNLLQQSVPAGSSSGNSYAKRAQIFSQWAGTLTVKIWICGTGGGGNSFAKVYKNGSAVGTEVTTNTTGGVSQSDNITVSYGDLIQIYTYNDSSINHRYAGPEVYATEGITGMGRIYTVDATGWFTDATAIGSIGDLGLNPGTADSTHGLYVKTGASTWTNK